MNETTLLCKIKEIKTYSSSKNRNSGIYKLFLADKHVSNQDINTVNYFLDARQVPEGSFEEYRLLALYVVMLKESFEFFDGRVNMPYWALYNY